MFQTMQLLAIVRFSRYFYHTMEKTMNHPILVLKLSSTISHVCSHKSSVTVFRFCSLPLHVSEYLPSEFATEKVKVGFKEKKS